MTGRDVCGFVWRDFNDDKHACGRPPGEHDPHLCESCPVMEFVDVGTETDNGGPVREPWRLDVPVVPEHVTAFKDGNEFVWVRLAHNPRLWIRWRDGGEFLQAVQLEDVIGLGAAPLVECEDPRGTS